jgi:hypothetical protein
VRGAATLEQLRSYPPAAAGRVCVLVCDDIVGREADGRVATDSAGAARLMSDGAGYISLDLARQVPGFGLG